MTEGFWPLGFFPDGYWPTGYWPEDETGLPGPRFFLGNPSIQPFLIATLNLEPEDA